MKHFQTLLVILLAVLAFHKNYAASVVNGTFTTTEREYTTPKDKAEKQKLHKKEKTLKKWDIKKVMGDGSGFNIAGFVLGLIGLFISWIPYLGLILCLLAVIFGGIGIKGRLKGLGIAGLVMGLIGLIIAIIVTLAVSI